MTTVHPPRRSAGFTLMELMIVVALLAVIAVIAIPTMLNARKGANESSAISSLRTLSTVNEQYRNRFGAYAVGLANLQAGGYVDSVLGGGEKAGYTFSYVPGLYTWSCQSAPTAPETTGDRYFFVDHTGVIRFSTVGPANFADPPVD